jgi:hypothetical protein
VRVEPGYTYSKRLSCLCAGALIFFVAGFLEGKSGFCGESWECVETKYAIIHYNNQESLEAFDDQINYTPGGWSLGNLFSSKSGNLFDSIAKKVDGIFEEIQTILDMRGHVKKVIINVYPSKKEFHEAYFTITGASCRLRAWYIFEVNTIYVNGEDVHEGILAHEIAHSIIDHYFSVRPPKATAEILARYVDEQLGF